MPTAELNITKDEAPRSRSVSTGFALDGLRANRDGHSSLGVPALSEDQLHRAMKRLHGVD
jgi:hypothetical protein